MPSGEKADGKLTTGLADGMQNLRFGYLKVCLESNYSEHKYNNKE